MGCGAAIASEHYLYITTLLINQQEEQSLCQRLRGQPASRNLLVMQKDKGWIHGDEHRGAKVTMPTDWRHANMWAPCGRSESLHWVWAFYDLRVDGWVRR